MFRYLLSPFFVFLLIQLSSCAVSYYPYSIPLNDSEITSIARQSESVSEFAQKFFDGQYYLSHVETKNSITLISTDIPSVQFAQIVGAYRKFCSAKDGKIVQRYVPAGLPSVIEEGFAEQPVFYYQSPMGRTEFEWCVQEVQPLFAMASTGEKGQAASGLYLLEQKDLSKYLDKQIKSVNDMAKDAEETLAIFRAADVFQKEEPFSVGQIELRFYTTTPQLKALFTNNTDEEQSVQLDTPLGLLIGNERYLLAPSLRADSKISANVTGEECAWDKSRTVLTIAAGIGKSCPLLMDYKQDLDDDKAPVKSGVLFFAGRSFAVTPVSEIGAKDSKIWLKPRIDKQDR